MKYIFLILLSSIAQSKEPMDSYYSDDLLDAVSQAKEQPHHYDYSNSYRYKRTTAQSIDLNRLNLNELDNTRLINQKSSEGPSNMIRPTDNPIANLSEKKDSSNTTGQPNISTSFIQTTPLNSSYKNSAGSYQATGIVQNGTVISMPRP